MDLRYILYYSLNYFSNIMQMLIFVRILLSWLPFGMDNFLVRTVHMLTEPIIAPIRNLIYKSPLGGPGMILDFSPLIAGVLLNVFFGFLKRIVITGTIL